MKNLLLRVDVDSYSCLKRGVPALLKIFKKFGIKATFFITFGREGNFFETFYYRRKRLIGSEKTEFAFPENKLLPLSKRKKELVQMLFFPKTLSKERSILSSIIDEGHDVQIHSYIHTLWKNPKFDEVQKDLRKAIDEYVGIFSKLPVGLSPPYHSISEDIAKAAVENGFKYVSVPQEIYDRNLSGRTPILNIPVTISKTSNFYPVTEFYARNGLLGRELIDASLKDLLSYRNTHDNEILLTYIHPRIEGIELVSEFEQICSILVENYNMETTFNLYLNSII